jgi:hypothetical protein
MNEVKKAYVVCVQREKDGSISKVGFCLKGLFLTSDFAGLHLSVEGKEFTLVTAPRDQGTGQWLPEQPITLVKDASGRVRPDAASLSHLGYLVPFDTYEAQHKKDRCPPKA